MRLIASSAVLALASCAPATQPDVTESAEASTEVWEGPESDGTVFGASQTELDRAGSYGEPEERFRLSEHQVASIAAIEGERIRPEDAEYFASFGEPGFLGGKIDLNADGVEELLVLSTSPLACGSGGCRFRVYGEAGGEFTRISGSTISRPPITVLDSTTNGWRDLTIFVCGGGINPCHHVIMRFDGESYPLNPSMQPEIATDQLGVPILTEASQIHPVPMP